MGDDVQQRQRPEAKAALKKHEAHLRHGGPGKGCLYRALGQHHHGTEQSRQPADHDERRHGARTGLNQIGRAHEKVATGVDDACMKQSRNGCGCLHDLGKPAMQRKGRSLERGGKHKERDRDMSGQRQRRGACLARQARKVIRAEGRGDQEPGKQQDQVRSMPDKRELGCRTPCRSAFGIEQQQSAQPGRQWP